MERSFVTRFDSIERAVADIAAGKAVVVVDDEDRENEGDLIFAAEKATPELVAFMVRYTSGYLCVPLSGEDCDRLGLPPMFATNQDKHGTAYTVTVDAREGIGTGISASDRAATMRLLADPDTGANDFTRPGHVVPLRAKEGGVLRRPGHTEAAVDLARMADLMPAGVLCEILDEEGDRANRPALQKLAREFDLPIISIEQLIAHRRQREKLVFRQAEAQLPTKYGNGRIIAYGVKYEAQEPIVYVIGDPTSVVAPLVRLHSSCFTGDLLESLRCDCGDQLHMALDMIRREGVGVLVYLPQEGRGIGLIEKIKAYALQDQGMDTVEANIALGYMADPRDYGVGIQLLKDLGLRKVRLLTNNPKKTEAFVFGGFDLEVVDQVPIVPPITEHNAAYLATKREKMGHHLP
jgi:3,4-dihydroxy 2-butanone 4-phosphate synthase/GTP cyclohydrolase II